MNPEPNDSSKMTDNIMRSLRSQQRTGRALIAIALILGILSIVASIGIAWANVVLVMPMQRLLLEDYPTAIQQSGKNSEGKKPLSREQLDWRHVQTTAAYGKAIFLTDASIALLAGGTLVILLLVIVNRRVALRQISVSLAQISQQIQELKLRQGPGS
jgi:hypothetical protein